MVNLTPEAVKETNREKDAPVIMRRASDQLVSNMELLTKFVKLGASLWPLLIITGVLLYFAGRLSVQADVTVTPTINVPSKPAYVTLDASTLTLPKPTAPIIYLLVPKSGGETKVIKVPPSKVGLTFPDHMNVKVTNIKDLRAPAEAVETPDPQPEKTDSPVLPPPKDTKEYKEFMEKFNKQR